MTEQPTSLCDRALLGDESQPRALNECHWITAIGTAIGLGTGAMATAAGAAIIGGGLGAIGANISSLVKGVYPWEDPGQFFKSSAIGLGTGAAGGAIGSAVGPALGAAAETLGLSSNIGTTAAAAGAPSGAASLSGQVPAAGVSLLSDAGGSTAGQGVLSEAIGKLGSAVGEYGGQGASQAAGQVGGQATGQATGQIAGQVAKPTAFLAQTLGEKPAALVRSTLTSGALGAAKDPEHPLRGALTGAAGSIVGSGINMGGQALFRGQEAGFFSPGPSRGFDFGRTGADYTPSYSLGSDPSTPNMGFGLRPEMGSNFAAGAARAGTSLLSRAGSSATGMGVSSALTPSPRTPPPNPYASYGYTPYWMRQ